MVSDHEPQSVWAMTTARYKERLETGDARPRKGFLVAKEFTSDSALGATPVNLDQLTLYEVVGSGADGIAKGDVVGYGLPHRKNPCGSVSVLLVEECMVVFKDGKRTDPGPCPG